MTLSMYQASVPVFVHMLGNLDAILRKGQADAAARKIDEAYLMGARLAPDMLPFTKQVQIACDMAVRGAAKIAGQEPPAMPDTEASFAELLERVARTVAYVRSLDEAAFAGGEARAITLKFPSGTMEFTGQGYLLNFALPNFYFHITAVYLLLRHNGVGLGKLDYTGRP